MPMGTGRTMGTAPRSETIRRRRERHQGTIRKFRISISVDENERRELEIAAAEEGLTVSAFVADRALASARLRVPSHPAQLREVLQGLLRATAQLQKAGTNFNQCVAALNTTGQPPGNLPQYARYTATVVRRVDEAASHVRQRLP